MLEITISATDRLVLTKSNLFNDNDVIDFSILLTYGKINKIETKEHKKVSLAEFSPKEEYITLAEKIANYNEIRIWYSSCDSEDLNTYYYVVNYLRDKNKIIYSCDVCNGRNFSLGCYPSDEIDNLLLNTKKLTKEEIINISLSWKQLEKENADLRVIEDNKLVSHDFDVLDNKILEKLNFLDVNRGYMWDGVNMKVVILAGGFGTELNIDSASVVGLFPKGMDNYVVSKGNTSLLGLQKFLTDENGEMRVKNIVKLSGEIVLAEDRNFEEKYILFMQFLL